MQKTTLSLTDTFFGTWEFSIFDFPFSIEGAEEEEERDDVGCAGPEDGGAWGVIQAGAGLRGRRILKTRSM